MTSDAPPAGIPSARVGSRDIDRRADRAWADNAVRLIEADARRSADTHLLRVDLPRKIAHAEFIRDADKAKKSLATAVRARDFEARDRDRRLTPPGVERGPPHP